jgi:hypothetical protein
MTEFSAKLTPNRPQKYFWPKKLVAVQQPIFPISDRKEAGKYFRQIYEVNPSFYMQYFFLFKQVVLA